MRRRPVSNPQKRVMDTAPVVLTGRVDAYTEDVADGAQHITIGGALVGPTLVNAFRDGTGRPVLAGSVLLDASGCSEPVYADGRFRYDPAERGCGDGCCATEEERIVLGSTDLTAQLAAHHGKTVVLSVAATPVNVVERMVPVTLAHPYDGNPPGSVLCVRRSVADALDRGGRLARVVTQ